MGLGVVGAVEALDNLTVLVFHRGSVLEDCDGILGVVVEVVGPQRVLVLVFELDQRAAELRHILVHHILQGLAPEGCPVLDDAYVTYRIDDVGVDIPESRVAKQVRIVMEEPRRAHDLPVTLAPDFHNLGRFCADQGDERIRILFPPLGK